MLAKFQLVLSVAACMLASVLDVAAAYELDSRFGHADISIASDPSSLISISSVTTGDLNGDGIDDVVLGGHFRNQVAVVFGKATLTGIIRLSKNVPPDLAIIGLKDSTDLYPPIRVADINGDNIGDLILPGDDGLDVFWGRKKWPAQIDAESTLPDLRIVVDRKNASGATARTLATTGDINGDGIKDLLLTHTFQPNLPRPKKWVSYDQQVGWIFWGKRLWPSVIDLSQKRADSEIWAEQPKPFRDHLRQLEIADLNGDGFGDIVVSGWGPRSGVFRMPNDGPWARAWIVQGSPYLPRIVRLALSSSVPDLTSRKGTHVVPLVLGHAGVLFGAGLSVGRLTGGKPNDVVLTLFRKEKDAFYRQLCLVRGHQDFFEMKEFSIPDGCLMITGDASLEDVYPYSTRSPVMGDFNGDGRDDLFLVLGNPDFSIAGMMGRVSFDSKINLTKDAEYRIITPIKEVKRKGFANSMTLGDINGDGRKDLLIVDPLGGSEKHDQVGSGSVQVLFGRIQAVQE